MKTVILEFLVSLPIDEFDGYIEEESISEEELKNNTVKAINKLLSKDEGMLYKKIHAVLNLHKAWITE